MIRKTLFLFAALLSIVSFTSCSSDDDQHNPFEEYDKNKEFNPTCITIEKELPNRTTYKAWSGIKRDKNGNITSYNYNFEENGNTGSIKEASTCSIEHDKDIDGITVMRAESEIDYSEETDMGVQKKYRKTVKEDITFNEKGLITQIDSYITCDDGKKESRRITLEYRNFFCIGCIYNDNSKNRREYKYAWDGYELRGIDEYEYENSKLIKTKKHKFKYNTEEVYPYKGISPTPFITAGLPEIYAHMGYFGEMTPYILEEEKQETTTHYIDGETSRTSINNTFRFYDSPKNEIIYDAKSDAYDKYTITFSK